VFNRLARERGEVGVMPVFDGQPKDARREQRVVRGRTRFDHHALDRAGVLNGILHFQIN